MGPFYPAVMPSPVRNADGSITLPDGSVLPFAASCPPDTEPTPGGVCVPSPGVRNINWECGGVLVPAGAGGCQAAQSYAVQPDPVAVPLVEFSATPAPSRGSWATCLCDGPVWAERGEKIGRKLSDFPYVPALGCFAVATFGLWAIMRGWNDRKGA